MKIARIKTSAKPICSDKGRVEKEALERLKAELTLAFSMPDSSYSKLDAQTIFDRND